MFISGQLVVLFLVCSNLSKAASFFAFIQSKQQKLVIISKRFVFQSSCFFEKKKNKTKNKNKLEWCIR